MTYEELLEELKIYNFEEKDIYGCHIWQIENQTVVAVDKDTLAHEVRICNKIARYGKDSFIYEFHDEKPQKGDLIEWDSSRLHKCIKDLMVQKKQLLNDERKNKIDKDFVN